MRRTLLILLLPALLGQAAPVTGDKPGAEPAARSRAERLLALHTRDAEGYAIYRGPDRAEKLALRREPVYRWTNPIAARGQSGDVFVWTHRGRPEVVGTIFSFPDFDGRAVCHEFNAISQAELLVERGPSTRWATRTPGMLMKPVPGAPTPAASAPLRLAQMRALAREFAARSVGATPEAEELRLLPTPIYREESTDPDVQDGGLFFYVNSAGTDPELLLMLEARKLDAGFAWTFGAARFSSLELSLRHGGQEVWNSVRGPGSFQAEAGKRRWWFSKDRIIPEVDAEPTKPEAK